MVTEEHAEALGAGLPRRHGVDRSDGTAAVDHLVAANWTFASVNTDEDSDAPEPPVPVPRPGDSGPGDEETNPPSGPDRAELMRFFA